MAEEKLKPKKILILGSGALKIGEAGEFDYSGSQAAKALREEGVYTILINPNIATIQTSEEFVNKVYFLPVTPIFVEKIIAKEKPDGILLGFGGQTALNCGMALHKKRVFEKYKVKVLGTPVESIITTEDRLLFKNFIQKLKLKVPQSTSFTDLSSVKSDGKNMKFPVLIRSGFSLGGLGSGVARNYQELIRISMSALAVSSQILVEEYLEHWKEIEYEVVRDSFGNVITVCNMENFDPMGIHTGESIVVAPSQTLNNHEYHSLREVAIKVINNLPIVGECNIQFGLNPKNGDYRIIEVNARLSRSSALASKATGYPLAYVAAKLALGFSLAEIKNKVTQATSAFFEPSLDYVVVKIPRWDFFKFKNMAEVLGSEMQSVGEVMAIGRTFEEAFQKAIRSLDIEYEGIISDSLTDDNFNKLAKNKINFQSLLPTPERPYKIAYNIFYGQSLQEIYQTTGIDYWFLERIKNIVSFYKKMLEESNRSVLQKETLRIAKLLGFSDQQIGKIYNSNQDSVRSLRKGWKILPKICQIDTLGGEFPAKTNYLYLSYHRTQHDVAKSGKKQVAVLGGGPYQIGSSVEFDWCAVNSVLTAKNLGYSPIMINNNPETVSTDYDISDKLYFEELTLERVLDIIDFENCPLIVSVGGQIPNTLVPKLTKYKVKLLGTFPGHIEQAEDRNKFSRLLDKLKIKQPIWQKLTTVKDTLIFANKIKYPVLLRPSFVLSGKAMFEAYSEKDLLSYFEKYNVINNVYPLVISKFIRGAREVDFDAVASYGKILTYAISEHVEHAGVHSGDATLVLPSFSLSQAAKNQIAVTANKISTALKIHGPFNIQFLVNNYSTNDPEILVIEANLRASRSFPFVSKTYGINFITLATKVMLKNYTKVKQHTKLDFYCVKVSRFSFTRLRKVDPILRVEMASTGEVASFGGTLQEAYLKAVLSTGTNYPGKAVLLSLGGEAIKNRFLPAAKILKNMGFKIYATENTEIFLKKHGIKADFVYKFHEKKHPCVLDLIQSKKVSLVINISERSDLSQSTFELAVSDGYLIRRATVDAEIPLFTKISIATLFVESINMYNEDKLSIQSWDNYLKK